MDIPVAVTFEPDTDTSHPFGRVHVARWGDWMVEGVQTDRASWVWYYHAEKQKRGPFTSLHKLMVYLSAWYEEMEKVL